jgi:uncharacterized protein YkwD
MPAHEPTRHGPRRDWSLAASALFAVAAAAAAVLVITHQPGRAAQAADAAGPAASASPADARPPAASYHQPTAAARTPATPQAHPHHGTHRAAAPASQPAATTPPPTPSSAPAATLDAAAAQVLALINQARAQAGLPAYTVLAGLDTSAARHNAVMAGGCGLSHQCPGEPALGARETAAGVHWTAAGENIGEGGPVAATEAATAAMAVGLTQSMLNEKPPDDGHRLNILSSAFTHIGIAVYRDSSGTVWLTQDFSN